MKKILKEIFSPAMAALAFYGISATLKPTNTEAGWRPSTPCSEVINQLHRSGEKFNQLLSNPELNTYKEVYGGLLFYSSNSLENKGIKLSFAELVYATEQFGKHRIEELHKKFPGLKSKIDAAKQKYGSDWKELTFDIRSCLGS